MSTTLARWRDNILAPFESGGGLFPFVTPEIRVEQYVEDDRFVVRAEIPGVDPENDVDVSVINGMLSIRAERIEEQRDRAQSEFHYGRLVRTVALPVGAREDTAKASYANGVLEVSILMGEPAPAGRHIAIDVSGKPTDSSQGAGNLGTAEQTAKKLEQE